MNNQNTTRREFLKTTCKGLAALSMSSVLASGANKINRPNIILIIGDDISWNDFGCYGHPSIKTPNIDKLATEGIKFTNAFLTASSCSPSRCSIITGRYPHNTGAAELHTPLPLDQIPFPFVLKETGYYTAAAGKWHLGKEAKRAFDLVLDKRELNGNGGEERWVEVIRQRPKDKSFFFWFASYDAHRIWGANEFGTPHEPKNAVVPPYLADTPETREDLNSYYNEIGRLDFYVGEVEKELEKQGIANNTMIIFMADNGRPFPRCKTRVYDSGMQTPFVIKWPNGIKKPGTVCKSLVSAIDIAPTILDVAGGAPLSVIQGKSFNKLFKKPESKFRNYVFSEHNWHDHEAHERMVRSEKYWYVINNRPEFTNCGPLDSNRSLSHKSLLDLKTEGKISKAQNDIFLAPRPKEELFDVVKDPHQLHNLADQPEYATVLSKLRGTLHKWADETGDTIPEKITADWYHRDKWEALEVKGIRGEMPGAGKNAEKIKTKGPF